ncbi:MAG: hypothetical protein AVDCRST_MAG68-2443 [uncultured Gemmatimonadetes bacterium]|uniref:Uncharacterized protein n=1 Tax=uncultured Gemmatimonadota bacterium TaxID=203437 RepID=A0A6J4LEZ2_9BACT|nr:MAG: hypothetical protein AVDCRST_MAG68-2443 [uncultured Gemmatimonadota bacterium]
MSKPDPVAAHTAFLEAARMLEEATGGSSVLMMEWAIIQQLAEEAAQLFHDLPAWEAPELEVAEGRRWWRRRAVRTVRQMYLAGFARESGESTRERVQFAFTSFLLGDDGVLRIKVNDIWFYRRDCPLAPGWLAVDDKRWIHVADLDAGAGSEPVQLDDISKADTAALLEAFERLATLTRDAIAGRLGHLRERRHL